MANASGFFSPSVPSLRRRVQPSIGFYRSGFCFQAKISKRVFCSSTIEGAEKLSPSQSRVPRQSRNDVLDNFGVVLSTYWFPEVCAKFSILSLVSLLGELQAEPSWRHEQMLLPSPYLKEAGIEELAGNVLDSGLTSINVLVRGLTDYKVISRRSKMDFWSSSSPIVKIPLMIKVQATLPIILTVMKLFPSCVLNWMIVSKGCKLVGCGSAVPSLQISNDDLAKIVETSDEWISVRTGIHNRRVLSGKDSLTALAVEAAKRALEMAQVDPDEVDLVLMCTSTPEDLFGSAPQIQKALGCKKNPLAYDITAACSGFVLGLVSAACHIRGGGFHNVLVIGADALSRYVDWTDRGTCILFGDAAGAILVQVVYILIDINNALPINHGILRTCCEGPIQKGEKLKFDGSSLANPGLKEVSYLGFKRFHYGRGCFGLVEWTSQSSFGSLESQPIVVEA
ncbi:3-oxoacyl-[acyl-carrier-protein] synthase 3 A, chloroplastic [Vitis vinifera]|uniref:3-oxoacyl-[acyl-carrier-protein] synthase 3 A, chloroplastic n=1 Tax=Vitis vinifera TaxID=29760 RepID=A0A438K2F0_VITVI|nr:3-oxoacyl-[acyl-carrier-protein] synthase 3 A, chloroplastic [Vitis vinifera]